MRRNQTAPLLLTSLLLILVHANIQVNAEAGGISSASDLRIPIGKSIDNFALSERGFLSYKGEPFNPTIRVNPDSVQAFRISLLKDKNLAAAIAEDVDGQNFAYLLDLSTWTATPLEKPGMRSAEQKVFWSPTGRYMLALCAYEGQRFIGVNLQTKKVVDGDFLGPEGKLWSITDEPRWTKGADTLTFRVSESCSPYDAPDCDPERILAKYLVSLNPATLKITTQKIK